MRLAGVCQAGFQAGLLGPNCPFQLLTSIEKNHWAPDRVMGALVYHWSCAPDGSVKVEPSVQFVRHTNGGQLLCGVPRLVVAERTKHQLVFGSKVVRPDGDGCSAQKRDNVMELNTAVPAEMIPRARNRAAEIIIRFMVLICQAGLALEVSELK